MNKMLVAIILGGAIVFGLTPGPAYAAGLWDDRVVFGGDAQVTEGEVVDGNLVVFGGSASIAEDAQVTGSVLVFGGSASVAEGAQVNQSMMVFGGDTTLAGQVVQDLVVLGGETTLEDTAKVGGEVVSSGGRVTREEGAVVGEGVTQAGDGPRVVVRRGPLARAASVLVNASVLAVLALLVVLLLPNHTSRVAETISSAAVASGGMGLLTALAVPVLLLLLAITICLIPISAVGGVVFGAALLMGWSAIGLLVGNRLAVAFNRQNLSPPAAAALGTFLFTIVAQALGFIPCIGLLVHATAWLLGLGAVVLTRFGRQAYLPPAAPPLPPNLEQGAMTG